MLTPSLPLTLYTAEQVRELDRIAIEEKGIAGFDLMTRAAQAAFELLQQQWPNARRLLVCCGAGNNGGDGYLLASIACQQGYDVSVLSAAEPSCLQGDAMAAFEQWQQSGGHTITTEQLATAIQGSEVVVDALLGTGLARNVEGSWAGLIETINDSAKPVLAVDIPSGLNANTGQVMSVAIKASCTITFIGVKQGMFTACGRDYCGDIQFHDLAVPAGVYAQHEPSCRVIAADCLQQILPARQASAHKGEFGHVLVIGGDTGMTGAVQMSAEAAARSGAGLVTVATRKAHAVQITALRPELMCHGVEQATELDPLLAKATVVAIGPGLGQSGWAQQLLLRVLESDLPLVVDADALNLISEQSVTRQNWILTPHPGEAARLLACSTQQVQDDRFAAVQAIAEKYNAVTLLKGSGSLVFDPQTHGCHLCREGNPGMASGGMGDVLTGLIAGLLAQGISLHDATCCGVYTHAVAADRVAEVGERGMLATDLLPVIRRLLNDG